MDKEEFKKLIHRTRKHPRRKELRKDLGYMTAGALGGAGLWYGTRKTRLGKGLRTVFTALPPALAAAIIAKPAVEFKRRLDELDKKKPAN